MSAIEEQGVTEETEILVKEIHDDWSKLRTESTSGQEAWLGQLKNHYTRIVQANPDAASELLASYEFHSVAERNRKSCKDEPFHVKEIGKRRRMA